MPVCSKCRQDRPQDRYAKQTGKHARHKFYKICIDCQTKQKKVWKEREKYYQTNERFYFFNKKYGLSKDAFNALYDQQQGKCAICGIDAKTRQLPGRWHVLYVDHSHTTGKVRGLLCLHCNSLLGFSRESIDRLFAAINYLSRNGG